MSKETLELEIKMLVSEALKYTQDVQGEIKEMVAQAKQAQPETQALAGTLKSMESEIKRAAAEAKLFGGDLGLVKRQQDMVKNAMIDMVASGLSPESDEVKKLTQEFNQLSDQTKALEKQTRVTSGEFSELAATMGQLAEVKALGEIINLTASIADRGLEAAKSWEKQAVNFGVLLGSAEAGRAIFRELQDFNMWTPFNLDAITNSAQALKSAKVPISELTDKMTMLGDLALGNEEKFTSFTLAYQKAAVKGKVDMENLNIMLERGIPVLDALADHFNVTGEEIMKMISTGKVSFEDFDNALQSMTSQGGQYFQGMAKGAETLDAAQIALKENVDMLFASFVQGFVPALTQGFKWMSDLTAAINESPILKGLLGGALTAITTALGIMAAAQVVSIAKTWLQYAAQMALNSALSITNPLLIAGIVAVGAATAAAIIYANKQMEASEETEALALAAVEQKEKVQLQADAAKDAARKIDKQTDSIKAQKLAIKEWKKSMDDFSDGVSTIDELNMKLEFLASTRPDIADEIKNAFKTDDLSYFDEKLRSVIKSLQEAYNKSKEDFFSGFGQYQDAVELLQDFNNIIKKSDSFLELKNKKIDFELAAEIKYRNNEEELKKQLDKINNWYRDEREKIEKDLILEAHKLRMDAYKAEWEYQQELARKNIADSKGLDKFGATMDYAEASFRTSTADTNAGQMLAGVDPITIFIDAILEAASSLESVQKLLNIFSTMAEEAFKIIGPLIDSALMDLVDTLAELGEIAGQLLAPGLGLLAIQLKVFTALLRINQIPLKMLGDAFEWFYNSVILPVGNKIIDTINGVIRLINKIPGISIKYLDKLKPVGDAAEDLAKQIEEASEAINKTYNSLIDDVEDLLSIQIDSLKKQFELGLISRGEYINQKNVYQDAANEQITALDEERNRLLEEIAEAINSSQIDDLSSTDSTDGDSLAEIVERLGPIVGFLKPSAGYASGSTNIPFNMLANVHQGEIIVPKTFAEGVKSGDISIHGKDPEDYYGKKDTSSYNIFNVDLTVEGSVIKERDLAKAMYNGISDLIESGEADPLPAA